MLQYRYGNVWWFFYFWLWGLSVRENLTSWQFFSQRDGVCVLELFMMEQKEIFMGKEQVVFGMVLFRFYGDIWYGKGVFDQVVVFYYGRVFIIV